MSSSPLEVARDAVILGDASWEDMLEILRAWMLDRLGRNLPVSWVLSDKTPAPPTSSWKSTHRIGWAAASTFEDDNGGRRTNWHEYARGVVRLGEAAGDLLRASLGTGIQLETLEDNIRRAVAFVDPTDGGRLSSRFYGPLEVAAAMAAMRDEAAAAMAAARNDHPSFPNFDYGAEVRRTAEAIRTMGLVAEPEPTPVSAVLNPGTPVLLLNQARARDNGVWMTGADGLQRLRPAPSNEAIVVRRPPPRTTAEKLEHERARTKGRASRKARRKGRAR